SRLAALFDAWDETEADALFADNVALDDSMERRREAARALKLRLGGLLPAGDVKPATPLRGSFALAEDRARVEVELDAERPPRVQFYEADGEPPVNPAPPDEVAGSALRGLPPDGQP